MTKILEPKKHMQESLSSPVPRRTLEKWARIGGQAHLMDDCSDLDEKKIKRHQQRS